MKSKFRPAEKRQNGRKPLTNTPRPGTPPSSKSTSSDFNERMKIIVFADDKRTLNKYIRMFYIIHKEKINYVRQLEHETVLMTDNLNIYFYIATDASRGGKAHYVINLSKKEEFKSIVLSATAPQKKFEDALNLPYWLLDDREGRHGKDDYEEDELGEKYENIYW